MGGGEFRAPRPAGQPVGTVKITVASLSRTFHSVRWIYAVPGVSSSRYRASIGPSSAVRPFGASRNDLTTERIACLHSQTLGFTLHKASSRKAIMMTTAIETIVVPPVTTTSGVEMPSQVTLTPR